MLGKAPKPREPLLVHQAPGGETGGGQLYAGPNFAAATGLVTQISSGASISPATVSYGMVGRGQDVFMLGHNTSTNSYTVLKSRMTGVDPYNVWHALPVTTMGPVTLSFQPREQAFYSSQSTSGGFFYAAVVSRSDSDGRAQLLTCNAGGSTDGTAWGDSTSWAITFTGLGISSLATPSLCSNIVRTASGNLILIYRVGTTGSFRRLVLGPTYEDLACTVSNAPATGGIRNIVMSADGTLVGFDGTGTGIYASYNEGVSWSRTATSSSNTSSAAFRYTESWQSPYVAVMYDATASSSSTRQIQAVARNGTVSAIRTLPTPTFLYGITDIVYWRGYWIVGAKSSGVVVTYQRTKVDIFANTTVAGDWEAMTTLPAGNGLGNAAIVPWIN